MLAQSFKTATELGFTEPEYQAAIKLLGMLERKEIKHRRNFGPIRDCVGEPTGFNMGAIYSEDCNGIPGRSCGTNACLCGWIEALARVMPLSLAKRVATVTHGIHPLWELFFMHTNEDITPDQGAVALRNYLTTGRARWAEALAAE